MNMELDDLKARWIDFDRTKSSFGITDLRKFSFTHIFVK